MRGTPLSDTIGFAVLKLCYLEGRRGEPSKDDRQLI